MSLHLSPRVRDRVVSDVALERGVSAKLIRGRRRFHYIAHARQEVVWRLRQLGYSFPQIGASLGLDHSTCIFACERHGQRLKSAAIPRIHSPTALSGSANNGTIHA